MTQPSEHRERAMKARVAGITLSSFDDLPLDLRMALSIATEDLAKLSDVYSMNALHYVRAMDRAIVRFPDRPWAAVHSQLLYILTNVGRWRGERARQTKIVLTRYVKAIEDADLT